MGGGYFKMSDLSSTQGQDEPAHNMHRLQQIRYKFIQMRYAYYCPDPRYRLALCALAICPLLFAKS